jgi:hypothetical protein
MPAFVKLVWRARRNVQRDRREFLAAPPPAPNGRAYPNPTKAC